MWVEVALEVGRSLNIVLVRNLQAVGDVKYPVLLGVCSQWAVGSASLIFWAFSWAGGWQASGPPSPWTKT